MNFTVLGPSDGQLAENKSDMTDGRFGGHREVSNVANAKDYTARSGDDPQKEENPVDETVRDVDEMTEAESRKREFSRREETSNVQKSNTAEWREQLDSDKRPRMDEGSDAVQVPEVVEERQRKKANPWQYDTSSTYEGEIS